MNELQCSKRMSSISGTRRRCARQLCPVLITHSPYILRSRFTASTLRLMLETTSSPSLPFTRCGAAFSQKTYCKAKRLRSKHFYRSTRIGIGITEPSRPPSSILVYSGIVRTPSRRTVYSSASPLATFHVTSQTTQSQCHPSVHSKSHSRRTAWSQGTGTSYIQDCRCDRDGCCL